MKKLVAESKIFKIYTNYLTQGEKHLEFEYATLFNDTTDSVMVAAITKDQKTVLVNHNFLAMDKTGWVFPGGKVDAGESVERAAIRELAEETNLLARKVTKLITLDILPKYFQGRTHLYLAEDIIETKDFKGDEIEDITIKKLSLHQLVDLIEKGEVSDSRTIALALFLKQKLNL